MRLARVLLSAVALCALPTVAIAQQDSVAIDQRSSSTDGVARPRRNILTVAAAYGFATEINGSVPTDASSLWIRWTHRTRARFLGGEPAWGFELVPVMTVNQEPRAYGAGGHFVYEHRWRPDGHVRPVLRTGAGMVFTNKAVPVGETRYNFSLFAGAGVEFEVARGRWFTLEYRLHHISNADTGFRNPGINAHTVGFGIAWAF